VWEVKSLNVSSAAKGQQTLERDVSPDGASEDSVEDARFCSMARGSASELEYQILLAHDLNLIQAKDYEKLNQQAVEIKRMLTVFIQKLNAAS
jgi:hypothetical protein